MEFDSDFKREIKVIGMMQLILLHNPNTFISLFINSHGKNNGSVEESEEKECKF